MRSVSRWVLEIARVGEMRLDDLGRLIENANVSILR